MRGPVLDIAVLDGVILAAAGTRLEVLELRGSTLQRTAFYDAQILLRSTSSQRCTLYLFSVACHMADRLRVSVLGHDFMSYQPLYPKVLRRSVDLQQLL